MFIHQLDVKCAFLNGDLPQPVYMKIPKGVELIMDMKDSSGKVCKLVKSLYGLKQSPKCWYDKLHDYLLNINFSRSNADPCLYHSSHVYLVIHVDDIILISKSLEHLKEIKLKLTNRFEMRDLTSTPLKFLGLNITKTEHYLCIDQRELIQKVINMFGMRHSKTSNIPVQPNLKLEMNVDVCQENIPYRELVGCLMYIMLGTRPDICYAVTYFSQFQNCFNEEHFKYLKNVLRYLKKTQNFGLKYVKSNKSNNNIIISSYVDADFANNVFDRKSISGFLINVYDNIVLWKCKKQSVVALSSTEAEYVSLSACVTECIFIFALLCDILNKNVYPVEIFEDNQSCIKMASTLETKRSKHIDVRHHFLRDCVEKGQIILKYVCTAEQVADVFTKALPLPKFKYFIEKLNVVDILNL